MKIKTKAKLFVVFLALVIAIPMAAVGCQEAGKPPTEAPAVGNLSSTLVPNMNLDIYVYIKQDRPTSLPSAMINAPVDISVESLAVWGVSTEDDLAFGGALTITEAGQAAEVHSQIKASRGIWSKLSGNIIYVVWGSSTAAESLKRAVTSNDFKYYDDEKGLRAIGALPDGGTTRLAGVAVVKPSKTLIGYIARSTDNKDLGMVNTLVSTARLDVIAAGLHAPDQIDVTRLAGVIESGGDISQLDLGILVLLKSGLPGFIVEPALKKLLTEAEFTERGLGELTVYHRPLDTGGGQAIPLLIRIEDNRIYGVISGSESYAKTLITGINQ
ncbi:hypothetical protein ACFLW8_03115 [Chloroflexota bacterium]